MKYTNTISHPIMLFISLIMFAACSSGDSEESTQLEKQQPQVQQKKSDIQYNFRMEMEMLLDHYFDLKNAMLESDIPAAKVAAEELSAFTREVLLDVLDAKNKGLWMGISQILRRETDKLIAVQNKEEMLIYFENISTVMISVADNLDPIGGPYYVMECEQADIGEGRWISREEQIRNPYQTSADVSCGEIVEEL